MKIKSRRIIIAVALISMLSLCFIGTAFAYNAVKGANKSNKIELLSNNKGENCSEEEVKKYSVHTNVDKNYPETYLWQGRNDQCIFFENSVIMDKALTENNVKHKYVVYDDTCHGFGVGKGTCAEGWIDDMLNFFNENNKE